jgi:hypothetical protein
MEATFQRFRNNPGKITEYGIAVTMLCEAQTGHISRIEICTAQRKKLHETVMAMLENNLGVHHVYHNNFYNNVKLSENLLQHSIRVCGTMRAKRGIPKDLEEAKKLKKEQSSIRIKCDITAQTQHVNTGAKSKSKRRQTKLYSN